MKNSVEVVLPRMPLDGSRELPPPLPPPPLKARLASFSYLSLYRSRSLIRRATSCLSCSTWLRSVHFSLSSMWRCLHALVAARLRVTAVLQRSPFLLETDHFFFAEASQLPVELAHRHAHQLLVRRSGHRCARARGGRGGDGGAPGGGGRSWLSRGLLRRTADRDSLVGLVVMVVVRVTDERFHRVLGRQVEGLWTDVMLVVGNPVEIFQLRLAR